MGHGSGDARRAISSSALAQADVAQVEGCGLARVAFDAGSPSESSPVLSSIRLRNARPPALLEAGVREPVVRTYLGLAPDLRPVGTAPDLTAEVERPQTDADLPIVKAGAENVP